MLIIQGVQYRTNLFNPNGPRINSALYCRYEIQLPNCIFILINDFLGLHIFYSKIVFKITRRKKYLLYAGLLSQTYKIRRQNQDTQYRIKYDFLIRPLPLFSSISSQRVKKVHFTP